MARKSSNGSESARSGGYRCAECGWSVAKWAGRCGECQAWGSLALADQAQAGPRTTAARLAAPALPIHDVSDIEARANPTGVVEFDRVLGGGLVPGAVVLLAGEPGVGKSTLLLEVAARVAGAAASADGPARSGEAQRRGGRDSDGALCGPVLYLTGEESAAQVRNRASRVGALADGLYLGAESDLGQVLAQVEHHDPALVVVDSVQTIASAEVEGAPGGVAQVREVAAALISAAKARGCAVILVGHVTKDGSVAGPRTLEHLVDVVLTFEPGDLGFGGGGFTGLRLLRAAKNRYGPTDEVGCFQLGESGLTALADPSGLFLGRPDADTPGTCVTVVLEGRRPLAVELQALVAPAHNGNPRRSTSGVESARLAMLLAVIHRHLELPLLDHEVYLATVGGARLAGPAGDLAAAVALASSYADLPLRARLVAIGEVGLSGEVRTVPGLSARLAEAARLGFELAVVAAGSDYRQFCGKRGAKGLRVVEATNLDQALMAAFAEPGAVAKAAAGVRAGVALGDSTGAGAKVVPLPGGGRRSASPPTCAA